MMLPLLSALETPNKADARVSAPAPFCIAARLNVEVETLEVLFQDEVDDAGDGVGAVHRRRATRDDLDALDRRSRDRVHVDGHRRVDRHGSIAVEQHEISVCTETTQADRGRARR